MRHPLVAGVLHVRISLSGVPLGVVLALTTSGGIARHTSRSVLLFEMRKHIHLICKVLWLRAIEKALINLAHRPLSSIHAPRRLLGRHPLVAGALHVRISLSGVPLGIVLALTSSGGIARHKCRSVLLLEIRKHIHLICKVMWLRAIEKALINLAHRPLSSIHAPMRQLLALRVFLLWGQHFSAES
jgi:ABC-type methionine transport system permease subunit